MWLESFVKRPPLPSPKRREEEEEEEEKCGAMPWP